MLGGCREASVEAALAAFAPFAGPPQATVIGRGLRLDLPRAALMNGLASSQHAYNDTHLRTVAHPTGPTLAPLLALAEHETLSGAQLLHALVLGIEVQCRVGLMLVTPPAEAAVGLSTQGVLGALGAAAAAGKALGLDEQRMVWAIGIASALAAGHRETHATMAGHLVPANAARAGLEAALLAAAGFTCGEAALEGEKGFARVYAREPNAAAALDGLGARWEIEALTYKP
jgi:2-methylcitrate dehydratase PrpD